MSGIKCFIGNPKISAKVTERIKEGLPEFDAEILTVNDEHKILHEDVNEFRKRVGKPVKIKEPKPAFAVALPPLGVNKLFCNNGNNIHIIMLL